MIYIISFFYVDKQLCECYNCNKNVTFRLGFKIKKIIATYKALLTEKGGASSYEAEGKWEGQFFAGSTEHYTINEIKWQFL